MAGEGTDNRHFMDDVVAHHIPPFIQRFLHIDCGEGALGARLKKQRDIAVFGIETDPHAAEHAKSVLDGVWATPEACGDGQFDCIYLPESRAGAALIDTLRGLVPRLAQHGMLLVAARNPRYWRHARHGAAPANTPTEFATTIAPLDLSLYLQWSIEDADVKLIEIDHGKVAVHEHVFELSDELTQTDLRTVAFLFWCTRVGYDPLAHAREQLTQGRPSSAYELLLNIPETWAQSTEIQAAIAAEKQLCLLVMERREGTNGRLLRFARAQRQFYHATAVVAGHPLAFECQIRFWNLIGDDAMARHLTRIYRQLHPDEPGELPALTPPVEPELVFPANDVHGIRRVLILTRTILDYGLDVLFDGLCTILGARNVVEFPWKPSLHGDAPDLLAHYPCVFNHPGAARTESEIINEAAAGNFDLILYGELDTWMDLVFLRRLATAAPNTPWAIVDQRDDPDDVRPAFAERIPEAPIRAYFKREWLQCTPWDGPVFPLPFAYPDALVPHELPSNRSRAVFWAGHAAAGLRRAYLDHLATTMGLVFPDRVSQEEYRAALLDSRIGLNFFGYGFDTVRYWELPAHGCMLLSNRLPIRIPHNFVDGQSAVFFDDLHDLETKLRHYLHHPDEAEVIAQAGHAHLVKHHTASARAKQLLSTVAACLQ